MKRKVAAWIALGVITLAAGLLLATGNGLTKDIINQQNEQAAQTARQILLPAAEEFIQLETPEGLDNLYEGQADGKAAGLVAQITTQGFGGPIEIIVGLDQEGTLTGISVGGSSFKETAGLGAKVKEEKFYGQFAGKKAPLTLKKDIDAVTAATISSTAVTNAVNKAVEIMQPAAATSATPEHKEGDAAASAMPEQEKGGNP